MQENVIKKKLYLYIYLITNMKIYYNTHNTNV